MTVKLPDWAIYAAITGALLLVSVAGRERADAPEAPPPLEGSEDALIGPPSQFEHTINVDPAVGPGAPKTTTAFSVGAGRWVTARATLEDCGRAAILLGGGQALEARPAPRRGLTAVLATNGGPAPLPLAPASALSPGQAGFVAGFAEGRPGELALRLVGRAELTVGGHGRRREPVLVWALVGRTRGLHGPMEGLDGGPVLDSEGRVVGVAVKEERQRGRLLTATPEDLAAAAPKASHEPVPSEPITLQNYGRAADTLRRDLRVAQVRCL